MAREYYDTYAELIEAYRTGHLRAPLIVDNDDCSVYINDERVFQGNPVTDFAALAFAAGIPTELA